MYHVFHPIYPLFDAPRRIIEGDGNQGGITIQLELLFNEDCQHKEILLIFPDFGYDDVKFEQCEYGQVLSGNLS